MTVKLQFVEGQGYCFLTLAEQQAYHHNGQVPTTFMKATNTGIVYGIRSAHQDKTQETQNGLIALLQHNAFYFSSQALEETLQGTGLGITALTSLQAYEESDDNGEDKEAADSTQHMEVIPTPAVTEHALTTTLAVFTPLPEPELAPDLTAAVAAPLVQTVVGDLGDLGDLGVPPLGVADGPLAA